MEREGEEDEEQLWLNTLHNIEGPSINIMRSDARGRLNGEVPPRRSPRRSHDSKAQGTSDETLEGGWNVCDEVAPGTS